MYKIVKEMQLKEMPFDRRFQVTEDREELCRATGVAVQFDHDPETWWNEYQDSDGDYWYGR